MNDKVALPLGRRAGGAMALCLIGFTAIFLRLWYLQVIAGSHFRTLSENNLSRTVAVPPPRGEIFDRNGTLLARSRPSFTLEFLAEDSRDPDSVITTVAGITGVTERELRASMARSRNRRHQFEPRTLMKDVSRDLVGKIAARHHQLPGVFIGVEPVREYVRGAFAPHVLGYVREISASQLEDVRYQAQQMGEKIGQYGIEKTQEYLLHGSKGSKGIVVNARGARVGESFSIPESAGHKVTLTIDARVQAAAQEAMEGLRGGVVALDPATGEVLALVSNPSFDPNMFIGPLDPGEWKRLITSAERPMINRVVQGLYPPGSVFKVFMAIAGLSEGVIDSRESISCPGYFRIGKSRPFHCHRRGGHGPMNVIKALQKSCNVFFYTVGQRLGIDRIHKYATQFGLGQPTGLELVDEPKGIVPSRAWKKAYFSKPEDKKWYPGETPSVSIGQGALSLSPLQVARAISAVVNGGKVLRPYLVRQVVSQDGLYKDDTFGVELQRKVDVSKEVLDIVKAGLFAVVNQDGGTARRARLEEEYGVKVAGKTSTAQIKSLAAREQEDDKETDIAWFAGYAPAEGDAEIVVVALVEDGGHGGVTSAPIAKAVMEAYFDAHPRPEAAAATMAWLRDDIAHGDDEEAHVHG